MQILQKTISAFRKAAQAYSERASEGVRTGMRGAKGYLLRRRGKGSSLTNDGEAVKLSLPPHCWLNIPDAIADMEYNLALHSTKFKQRWRERSVAGHVWKAIRHLVLFFVGNKSEPHICHALTRLAFAAQLAYENGIEGTYRSKEGWPRSTKR